MGLLIAVLKIGPEVAEMIRAGWSAREAVAVPKARLDGRVMGMKPGWYIGVVDVCVR